MLKLHDYYGEFRTHKQTFSDPGLLIEYRVRFYRKEEEPIAFHRSPYDFNYVV